MDQILPWQDMVAVIEPFYPKAGNGRPARPAAGINLVSIGGSGSRSCRLGQGGITLLFWMFFVQKWRSIFHNSAEKSFCTEIFNVIRLMDKK
jgi:hypothetical protein